MLLQATALAPDGPPVRFAYRGQAHQIARHQGPERIETGWWRKRGVRRDYYRVETEQGTRFWLFRSLTSGRWYLHGEFA
jgi:protein ImuB